MVSGLGGTLIKRSKIEDVYLGEKPFYGILIVDIPSKHEAVKMFESDEYKQLIPLREKGFNKIEISFAEDIN